MPDEPKTFWASVPGIITAIAGLVTAIAVFLTALNSIGLLPKLGGSSGSKGTPTPVNSNSSGPVRPNPPTLLPAPRLLAHRDGTIFSAYPRTTTVSWEAVPGANSYIMEWTFLNPGSSCPVGWPTESKPVENRTTDTSFTFSFKGAQPGCWRVSAVDAEGKTGRQSPWWEFFYTK